MDLGSRFWLVMVGDSGELVGDSGVLVWFWWVLLGDDGVFVGLES